MTQTKSRRKLEPSPRKLLFGAVLVVTVAWIDVYFGGPWTWMHERSIENAAKLLGDPVRLRAAIQACVDAGGQWIRDDCYTPSK